MTLLFIASFFSHQRRRFGFPNRDALDAGETGTACRGEEHDVTIVWSIFTGKRLILADGQEVHYSMARGTKLEFSWTLRGNRVLKVVAHAAPQVNATLRDAQGLRAGHQGTRCLRGSGSWRPVRRPVRQRRRR